MRSDKSAYILSGKSILVYTKGSEILQIRASEYTSPSVFAMHPCFDESFDSLDSKRSNGKCLHNVLSSICSMSDGISRKVNDIRVCDAVEEDIFVRYCEAIRPFKIKLSIASYVRKSLMRCYRIGRKNYDVIAMTLPAGVGFYKNEFTACETKILLAIDGDARISDSDEIEILCGSSRIAFACGDSEECLLKLSKVLEKRRCISDVFVNDDTEKAEEISEKLLYILKAQQSYCGGVMASASEPIVRTADVDVIVSAFLKYRLFDDARKTLEFFCERFEDDRCFYQIYSSVKGQKERYFSDSSNACANLMSAVLKYTKITGDTEFLIRHFKMMKSAMRFQLDECVKAMMPFSGAETEGYAIRSYGSLEATLTPACAILDFTEYCEKNSLRLQNDNGSAARRAKEMLDAVRENFVKGSLVFLASDKRTAKLPRFAYGDCDACAGVLSHIYYGELERSRSGRYLCPRCFGEKEDDSEITLFENRPSLLASALLLSQKRMRDILGYDKSVEILSKALETRALDSGVISLRTDTLLLPLAREYGFDKYAEILEKEILYQASCGALVNEMLDTGSAASILVSL